MAQRTEGRHTLPQYPFFLWNMQDNLFPITLSLLVSVIISRQVSLAWQAFLITALHGTRSKTGKNAYAKK